MVCPVGQENEQPGMWMLKFSYIHNLSSAIFRRYLQIYTKLFRVPHFAILCSFEWRDKRPIWIDEMLKKLQLTVAGGLVQWNACREHLSDRRFAITVVHAYCKHIYLPFISSFFPLKDDEMCAIESITRFFNSMNGLFSQVNIWNNKPIKYAENARFCLHMTKGLGVLSRSFHVPSSCND